MGESGIKPARSAQRVIEGMQAQGEQAFAETFHSGGSANGVQRL